MSTYPSFETVGRMLHHWADTHPDRMSLAEAGRARSGRPVYCVELTDPACPAEDKEHALITALHSGVERSGTTTVCAIIEWLLSDAPDARETLRKQHIACIPVAHPDGYVDGNHGSVYGGWTLDGPADPEGCPEALAVKSVMDRLQPELLADVHGMSMAFNGYDMLENSANSYSNLALRCFHPEVVQAMDDAALEKGYPSDRQESDAERLFWGPALDVCKERLWVGRPNIYAAIYAYYHYHTMLSTSEVGWERSGLVRHKCLLQVGNDRWPGEFHAGYPNRVVRSNHYHMITPYGQTATARRESRVELWGKQERLAFGMVDPPITGKTLAVCATSPTALGSNTDPTVSEFTEALRRRPDVNVTYLAGLLNDWPAGQNRDVPYIYCAGKAAQDTTIEHGLSIRLRVFSGHADIDDVRLNGHPLKQSETDGYMTWSDRSITYVQINIPPAASRNNDLFIASCEYTHTAQRKHWDTWRQFTG
ncbi:MAG: hypothetical protein HN742_21535 [Lentisphaerae bacterium]|jgi:hypothetical protein|nr:hypothetical protein [Lentisphaerota bacterium]MBT4816740.1 hypothetical protein [Lentisphaerota bacterium]MBT5613083.1 hypothetical protein [Lentisphaerota bacterium]MBT7056445.1 hypothetical protein [Lentisphaerota bacterium]MBT7844474.1 hypothetical protein [Lentisphaerota bacterium]